MHSSKEDHNERTTGDYAVGEFIIASFHMEEQNNKIRRFVGCIQKINDDETLTVKFLISKNTRNNSGFIYTYPNVDDIVDVKLNQVARKLSPPKQILRGALQFDINVKDL